MIPMRIGLALGSGGLRGAAHIGILEVLGRERIPIHAIAGTSAGSIISVMYASGMSPEEMSGRAVAIRSRDVLDPASSTALGLVAPFFLMLLGCKTHLPKGVLKGEKLEQYVESLIGSKMMSELNLPCAAVSVDIHTGDKVVFGPSPLTICRTKRTVFYDALVKDAVRASCAIPGVFAWKEWNGRYLVDGAVREPVPAKVLREMGCDYVIAVDLGFTGQAEKPAVDILSIVNQALDILGEETSDYVLKNNADIVIKPKLYSIPLTAFDRIPECIDAGRKAARAMMPAMWMSLSRRRAWSHIHAS